MSDELLRTGQLAKRLNVCPDAVRKWARGGTIPVYHVGRGKHMRFDYDEVVDSLKGVDRGGMQGQEPHRMRGLPLRKDHWPSIQRDAVKKCRALPEEASLADEWRWILSRMREWPDFTAAPSQIAVKVWLALNDPGGCDVTQKEIIRRRYAVPVKSGPSGRSANLLGPGTGPLELDRQMFGDEEGDGEAEAGGNGRP